MKVNTKSGEYAGKTNNCHLEASHTHTQTLKQWLEESNEWITESWMALQMYWMGQDGDANKHAQASRRLPLTKRIQLIRLALCWNVRTDHWWKINVSGKKNCIPRSQHSVRFTNIRELCVSRPWALRNCQNPWVSREIRESWRLWCFMQIIFIEAGIEHVCNISNRKFQKFPLAFRAGQFVDDTFYCR